MANPRVKVSSKAVREILTSRKVLADLQSRAARIAGAAGPGHIVDSQIGPNRARAAVITGTFDAIRAEATNHTLTRSIDAGR